MRRLSTLALVLTMLALLIPSSVARAQTYLFQLTEETVDIYWENDGSLRLEYVFVFVNDASASPMEYIDVGLPTDEYSLPSIYATIDGQPIGHIAPSQYSSPGVELGLGANAIRPGGTGTVTVSIGRVEGVLYEADDAGYVSAVFSPTWFGSQYVYGSTDLTVTVHLPPGVQPDEGRWFEAPSGWPSEPVTGLGSDGRVVYQWRNASANGYTQYLFGAAFPATYVPSQMVAAPTLSQRLGIDPAVVTGCLCTAGFVALVGGSIALAIHFDRRRKLAYLPPKIAIEGHGIKRGLTAVEAAVLLENPLDRVLTMILFAVVKKNAARVVSETPLKVEASSPRPEGLHEYESAFLDTIVKPEGRQRQTDLQKVMIDLVTAVQKKMKGFSLRESKEYYQAIIRKAWQEVEQAGTPEIRSQKFDDGLEWTMLDRDFDERTQRTFRTGPVFLPVWWGNYHPSPVASHPSASPVSAPPIGRIGSPGGGVSLPHLPGSDFAASFVRSVQNTAGSLVSNTLAFTSGVTSRTNPPPAPRPGVSGRSGGFSGGGGRSCACACACAGCACACAGGGR